MKGLKFRNSVNLFVLQFHDVLLGDVEVAQLANLLLLDALQECLLALKRLLQLLVLHLASLALLVLVLVLLHDLLLQFRGVLLQQLLALVLQLLLQLLHLLLPADDCLELGLLSPRLLLQHAFFLLLLLVASILQFLASLRPDFCLHFLLLPRSSLVGLGCSFGPQCIQLGLPIGCFFLQLPQSLDLSLLFVLNSFLFCNDFCFFFRFFFQVRGDLVVFFPLFLLPLLNDQHGIFVGFADFLVHFVLLLLLFLK